MMIDHRAPCCDPTSTCKRGGGGRGGGEKQRVQTFSGDVDNIWGHPIPGPTHGEVVMGRDVDSKDTLQ